jgi:hypothetical protein
MSAAPPPTSPPPTSPPSGAPPADGGGRAVASLVLGIVSIIACCHILGPIAWVLGHTELKHIRAGQAPLKNEGIAKAGMILGIIASVLFGFGLLWIFLFGGLTAMKALIEAAQSS